MYNSIIHPSSLSKGTHPELTSSTSPHPSTSTVGQEPSTLVSILEGATSTAGATSAFTATLQSSTSSASLQPSVSIASQEPSTLALISTSVAQLPIASCCGGSGVIDFDHFLSDDPGVFNRICSIMPPLQALSALEATFTERQLQGYNFIYTESGQLDNATYKCWSKLQDLCKQTDNPCVSDILATSDLPSLNMTKSDENSLLLSCSLSEVTAHLSGLTEILSTAAADCEIR